MTIHTNPKIDKEYKRIDIKREREIHEKNKDMENKLKKDAMGSAIGSAMGSDEEDSPKNQTEGNLQKEENAADDKKESGTQENQGEEEKKDEEKEQYYDEDGKEINLDDEGDLPGLVLNSLKATQEETVAQNRGDLTYEANITN